MRIKKNPNSDVVVIYTMYVVRNGVRYRRTNGRPYRIEIPVDEYNPNYRASDPD